MLGVDISGGFQHVIACLLMVFFGGAAGAAEMVVVRPEGTGEALINPGMGWAFHHYENGIYGYGRFRGIAYDAAEFPGLSTVYLRTPWSHVEPEEGQFRWEVLDTPAQRYIERGGQVAFRITCCESAQRFATPKWVKDAGAAGVWFKEGHPVPAGTAGAGWEPVYDDPVFLAKLDHFLAAFAARYDRDPNVAYVDIGTFGMWGEGHAAVLPAGYTEETVKRLVDLHFEHFKKTQLIALDDWPGAVDAQHLPGPGVEFHYGCIVPFYPKEHVGEAFNVHAGFWQPFAEEAERENRPIPERGTKDREVFLGMLRIEEDGVAVFESSDKGGPVTAENAVYRARFGQLSPLGTGLWALQVAWTLLQPMIPRAVPFYRFDSVDGALHLQQWPYPSPRGAVEYARERGAGFRDDTIGAFECLHRPYFRAQWQAESFWPHAPVIVESGHLDWQMTFPWFGDLDWYRQGVEQFHASFIALSGTPERLLDEFPDVVRAINLRLGYRIQLVEARWPEAVFCGDTFRFAASWRNAGVAPLYAGAWPAVTLSRPSDRALALVMADSEFNMRELPVAPPGKAEPCSHEIRGELTSDIPPGEYDVCVSVGSPIGTPRIALPLADNVGERRYRLGTVRVLPEYSARADRIEMDGQGVRITVLVDVHRHLPAQVAPFVNLRSSCGGVLKDMSAEVLRKPDANTLRTVGKHEVTLALRGTPEGAGVLRFGLVVPANAPVREYDRPLPAEGDLDNAVVIGSFGADKDEQRTFSPTRPW